MTNTGRDKKRDNIIIRARVQKKPDTEFSAFSSLPAFTRKP